MNNQPDTRRKSVNWNGPRRAMLALALLLPAFGVTVTAGTYASSQRPAVQSAISCGLGAGASQVALGGTGTLTAVNWNDELLGLPIV